MWIVCSAWVGGCLRFVKVGWWWYREIWCGLVDVVLATEYEKKIGSLTLTLERSLELAFPGRQEVDLAAGRQQLLG